MPTSETNPGDNGQREGNVANDNNVVVDPQPVANDNNAGDGTQRDTAVANGDNAGDVIINQDAAHAHQD